MSQRPRLFEPIELGGITLPNRIVVAPMCQYSAEAGCMTDWHLVHLGQFALSRAGMFFVEATGVTPEGRITPRCTGLYDDANEQAMARALAVYRSITSHPIGIQLAQPERRGPFGMFVLARLATGATFESASRDMQSISDRLASLLHLLPLVPRRTMPHCP